MMEKKISMRIHYENMTSSYEACKEIIEREWSIHGSCNKSNPIALFQKVIKVLMARLKWWSKEEFGMRENKLEEINETTIEVEIKLCAV